MTKQLSGLVYEFAMIMVSFVILGTKQNFHFCLVILLINNLKRHTSLKMEAYEKRKSLFILKDYIRHLRNINIDFKFISQTKHKNRTLLTFLLYSRINRFHKISFLVQPRLSASHHFVF